MPKRKATFKDLVNYPKHFDLRAKSVRNYEIVCRKYGFLGFEKMSYKELSQEFDLSVHRLQVIIGRYLYEVIAILQRLEELGYEVDWGEWKEVEDETDKT